MVRIVKQHLLFIDPNTHSNAINNKEGPNYLSRSNTSSGNLEEFPKPKITRSAISKPFGFFISPKGRF
jgi:hypothetical protein